MDELQEAVNKLAAEIKTRADEFNAGGAKFKDTSARTAWEKVNADYDAAREKLLAARASQRVAQRAAEVADQQGRSVGGGSIPGREDRSGKPPAEAAGGDGAALPVTDETRALAIAGWMAGQVGGRQTRQHLDAMGAVGLHPWQRELTIDLLPTHRYTPLSAEFRRLHPNVAAEQVMHRAALSTQTANLGGNLIPETLVRQLEVNMLAFGGMRQVAETITTGGGEPFAWPTADDTGNEAEILGESTSFGPSVAPTFGRATWGAYKFSSKPILVPYELLEDSAIDLPTILGQMLGERIGRGTNRKFTVGTGVNEPTGILTAAALGVTAASATTVQPDELINLIHSVDPAYRNGARFMFNDAIALTLRKIKDTVGQYIWQSGIQDGLADRLFGYPITYNQHMPTPAIDAKTVLFGQLNKYKIRRVRQVRFYRLEERYRDTDQDGFVAFLREDGNLLSAGTMPVKYLKQAAA